MKKRCIRWTALVLSLLLALSLAGCTLLPSETDDQKEGTSDLPLPDGEGTNDPTQEGTDAQNVTLDQFDPEKVYPLVDYFALNAADYVQLGRYKNMTLSINKSDVTISDTALQAEINAILAAHHPDAKITDRPVQEGDIIVMDYVGKLNGEAFQGGTGLNQTITVNTVSNGFIPGFVDGMIGLVPGEMKEVPVTFPEDYGKEELNGQDAIFEMTVHYIVGKPTLDDAFVADYTEGKMTTAEEFTASLRADIEQQLYDSAVRNALWIKIMENAAVNSYPADAVMYYYGYYYTMYNQYAAAYGMDYKTFLAYNQMTPEYLFEYCKSMVKQDLIRHAVYQAGGYSCTEEQYQNMLDEYTAANYDSLRTAMIAQGETDYTLEQAKAYFHENYESQLKDTCLDGIVTKDLQKNATISVVEESAS